MKKKILLYQKILQWQCIEDKEYKKIFYTRYKINTVLLKKQKKRGGDGTFCLNLISMKYLKKSV